MPTRIALAAGCACAVALPAPAAINSRIDVLASLDGVNFSPTLTATPGSTVEVLVRVTYTGAPGALGLSSLTFQPTVSNWRTTDKLLPFINDGVGGNNSTPPGVVPNAPGHYGRITPWGRTHLSATAFLMGHVHTDGSAGAPSGGWLRIAQRQVTNWFGGFGNTTGGSGVPTAQLNNIGRLPTDPPFNPNLSVNVLRFGFILDNDWTNWDRTMLLDVPEIGMGNRNATTGERQVYWFASMDAETIGTLRGGALINPATLHVIPTPATLAPLALGLLTVLLRRRPASTNPFE